MDDLSLLPRIKIDLFSVRIQVDLKKPLSEQLATLNLTFDPNVEGIWQVRPLGKNVRKVLHLVHFIEPRHPQLAMLARFTAAVGWRAAGLVELVSVARYAQSPRSFASPYLSALTCFASDSDSKHWFINRVGNRLISSPVAAPLESRGARVRMIFETA